jgi:hypothetical protein
MLSFVRWFELVFALIPIKYLMKIFCFSDFFANTVALPMVALFLGTGNYTPEVPSMIMERLCTSPTYGMWYPPDKHSISTVLPAMVVFPKFTEFYESWRKDLVKRAVDVRLSTEVTKVLKRDKNGVVVMTKPAKRNDQTGDGLTEVAETEGKEEKYDEIVLCVL